MLCRAAIVSFVIVGFIHTVRAQEYVLEFKTSFPFTVGDATVPAGRYTITPTASDLLVLELRSGEFSVLFGTTIGSRRDPSTRTEIVFERYGERYVLKRIWTEGADIG